jgi:hypothetical protein
MTVLMSHLVVERPGGQVEVFHDRRLDQYQAATYYRERCGKAKVYSYEVLPNNDLKVYAHKVKVEDGKWKGKTKGDPLEIAHFRANQWDMVRTPDEPPPEAVATPSRSPRRVSRHANRR